VQQGLEQEHRRLALQTPPVQAKIAGTSVGRRADIATGAVLAKLVAVMDGPQILLNAQAQLATPQLRTMSVLKFLPLPIH